MSSVNASMRGRECTRRAQRARSTTTWVRSRRATRAVGEVPPTTRTTTREVEHGLDPVLRPRGRRRRRTGRGRRRTRITRRATGSGSASNPAASKRTSSSDSDGDLDVDAVRALASSSSRSRRIVSAVRAIEAATPRPWRSSSIGSTSCRIAARRYRRSSFIGSRRGRRCSARQNASTCSRVTSSSGWMFGAPAPPGSIPASPSMPGAAHEVEQHGLGLIVERVALGACAAAPISRRTSFAAFPALPRSPTPRRTRPSPGDPSAARTWTSRPSRSPTPADVGGVGAAVLAQPMVEVEDREPHPEEPPELATSVVHAGTRCRAPPETATSTRSPGATCSCSRDRRRDAASSTRATAGGRRVTAHPTTRAIQRSGSLDLAGPREVPGLRPHEVEPAASRSARRPRRTNRSPASYCATFWSKPIARCTPLLPAADRAPPRERRLQPREIARRRRAATCVHHVGGVALEQRHHRLRACGTARAARA